MEKQLTRLFEIYKQVLTNHIGTKTTYSQFHEKTQEMYETLFSVFHTIAEKRQDIGLDNPSDESVIESTYDLIEEAKTIIEGMVKEKNSIGMDNLLRGHVDTLEGQCGNARAFLGEEKEEKEEYEEYEESKKSIKLGIN